MTQKILVELTDMHKQLIGSTAVVFFFVIYDSFQQCSIKKKKTKQIIDKEQGGWKGPKINETSSFFWEVRVSSLIFLINKEVRINVEHFKRNSVIK